MNLKTRQHLSMRPPFLFIFIHEAVGNGNGFVHGSGRGEISNAIAKR